MSPPTKAITLAIAICASGCWLVASLDDVDSGVDAGDAMSTDAPSDATGDAVVEASDGGCLSSYQDNVLVDGPHIYLQLAEANGPTAADVMQNYDGIYADAGLTFLVDGAILTDPTNTAIHFDGAHGITIPQSPTFDFAPMQAFTVELWAKQDTFKDPSYLVDHEAYGDSGLPNNRWGWNVQSWTAAAFAERRIDEQLEGNPTIDGGVPIDGRYHHLVFTYDPTGLSLFCAYLDGEKVTCVSAATIVSPIDVPSWTIGVNNCACVDGFIGSIDEIAIYGKSLSADRIKCHYHAAGYP